MKFLVFLAVVVESEVSDSDEEIYGGEISVWNRSWAKEINHMLC
jgi:hypothetical protein